MIATQDGARALPARVGPVTAWLALTEACNNECAWCYESTNTYADHRRARSSAKHLCLSDLQVALPTLVRCGLNRTILIGGEPTLNPEVCEIISYVNSLNLKSALVTNGRSSSKIDLARAYAEAGLQEATVSLHGWSAESYEGRGSPASFAQALAGLRNLKGVGIRTGATMVLGSHTLGHERDIISFLRSSGISRVQFNIAAPAVSPTRIDASFTGTPRQMAAHTLLMHRLCTSQDILVSFQLNLPFCLFDPADLDAMLEVGAIKQSCHVFYGGGIVLRPELKTAVCTHLMEFCVDSQRGRAVYDNAESFLAFWRSSELETERSRANAYRREDCEACSRWKECGGGCMVFWTYYDARTFEAPKTHVTHFQVPSLLGKGATS